MTQDKSIATGMQQNIFLRVLASISEVLAKVSLYTLFVFFLIASIVVLAQIFFRYVLHASIPWSEELARYLFIWVIFLGISVAVKTQGHVGVEAVVIFLPKKYGKIVKIVASLFVLVFFVILFNEGLKVVAMTKFQLSPAMHLSMSIPYAAIPVTAALSVIHGLRVLFEQILDFNS